MHGIELSGDQQLYKHSNRCLHGLITELKTMMMMNKSDLGDQGIRIACDQIGVKMRAAGGLSIRNFCREYRQDEISGMRYYLVNFINKLAERTRRCPEKLRNILS